MHGHFGGGNGFLLVLIIITALVLLALWPGHSQTK
jgi:hypothetical protein